MLIHLLPSLYFHFNFSPSLISIPYIQLQLQEEESMHAEVDKWQRRYQNINYELEVQKTKMKER